MECCVEGCEESGAGALTGLHLSQGLGLGFFQDTDVGRRGISLKALVLLMCQTRRVSAGQEKKGAAMAEVRRSSLRITRGGPGRAWQPAMLSAGLLPLKDTDWRLRGTASIVSTPVCLSTLAWSISPGDRLGLEGNGMWLGTQSVTVGHTGRVEPGHPVGQGE